jgi:competence protein ComGC
MRTLGKHIRAFTVTELLAIVAVLAFFAMMVLPAFARTKASVQRIDCTDNLKQIGLAFQTWAGNHSDMFPMHVSPASGGYGDYVGIRVLSSVQSVSRGAFGFFMVMSNELGNPKLLICPSENESRLPATTFVQNIPAGSAQEIPLTNDLNTSYFVGVDAVETGGKMLLAGDHNLGSDGNTVPIRPFVTAPSVYSPDFKVALGTNFMVNAGVGWLSTMHSRQGNAVMGDGSVQQYDRVHLQQTLQSNTGSSSIVGGGPNFPLPAGCNGIGINRIQFP